MLAHKDVPASYHLSVTVNDHLQRVTLVTRGKDLFRATDIQYCKHFWATQRRIITITSLLTDATGRRFAKRDKE